MGLDKFDYVLALAEERNLTRAAKKAFISQPALTNYVNKLEQQLGVKLFDRSVTPIQITRAGSIYIERMKRIQAAENALCNELKILGSQEVVFHLGIGITRGSHWLPYLIPEFCHLHPEVALQLHEQQEGALEAGVRHGEIDLAYGVFNAGFTELTYVKIADEPVLLAIPRTFPCVSGLSADEGTPEHPVWIDPKLVQGISFLLPYPGGSFSHCSQRMLSQAKIVPGRILNYANMNTAYQLAAMGVGALFITPALFDNMLPNLQSKLAYCTLQEPVYTRSSMAIYRPENPKLALIEQLLDVTRAALLPKLSES